MNQIWQHVTNSAASGRIKQKTISNSITNTDITLSWRGSRLVAVPEDKGFKTVMSKGSAIAFVISHVDPKPPWLAENV
jgi:hypothetical protein